MVKPERIAPAIHLHRVRLDSVQQSFGSASPMGGLRSGGTDPDLFLFAAREPQELAAVTTRFARGAACWTPSQMAVAARESVCQSRHGGPWRAAVLASDTTALEQKLLAVSDLACRGQVVHEEPVWLGPSEAPARIGFLFSGTSPMRPGGGRWADRFRETQHLLSQLALHRFKEVDHGCTALEHGWAAVAALSALAVLERCNLTAHAAVSANKGDLAALTWAGAIDQDDTLPLALAREKQEIFRLALANAAFDEPLKPLHLAATGEALSPGCDLRRLLMEPPRGTAGLGRALETADADLWIEVGAGDASAQRVSDHGRAAVATGALGTSVSGILAALATAFVLGAPVNAAALYEDRRLPDDDPWEQAGLRNGGQGTPGVPELRQA